MANMTPTRRQAPAWQRRRRCWQLIYDNLVVAFIEHDGSRWLCYTAEDTGDDGFLGLMPSLADAKGYLERRAAFAAATEIEDAVRPL